MFKTVPSLNALLYICFALCSLCFQGIQIGAVSAFRMGNYPCKLPASSLSVNYIDFLFLLKINSDAIKDFSSGKMSESFTSIEVIFENIYFAFSLFTYLLVGSQRCTMFLLKLLNY